MPSLYKDVVSRLREILPLEEPLPIKILADGFTTDNPYKLPVIFIGHKYHRILLFSGHITETLLAEIFDKALRDNNRQAIVDLLQYISHNEISFWENYRDTELAVKIMATVLGQHD